MYAPTYNNSDLFVLVGERLELFLPLGVELFLHVLGLDQSLLVELSHQSVLFLAVLPLKLLLVLVQFTLRLAHLPCVQVR